QAEFLVPPSPSPPEYRGRGGPTAPHNWDETITLCHQPNPRAPGVMPRTRSASKMKRILALRIRNRRHPYPSPFLSHSTGNPTTRAVITGTRLRAPHLPDCCSVFLVGNVPAVTIRRPKRERTGRFARDPSPARTKDTRPVMAN